MLNIFNFGENVNGYTVKVFNKRELRAGAGILFLIALFSFVNCIVMKNIAIMQMFIWLFLVEFTIRVLISPKYARAKQKRFAWSIELFLAVFIFFLTTIFPLSTSIIEESLHNALIGLSCIICLILLYIKAYGFL